jgi:hypothetical protein
MPSLLCFFVWRRMLCHRRHYPQHEDLHIVCIICKDDDDDGSK